VGSTQLPSDSTSSITGITLHYFINEDGKVDCEFVYPGVDEDEDYDEYEEDEEWSG
jgi:hypothetical protein